MPAWSVPRTGQFYLAEEATYAAAATLAATHAFRHLNAKLSFNPRSPVPSPERHLTPDQRVLYTRRQSGSFDVLAQRYPSGVLNTVPESDLVLKHALGGTPTNITLATTVSSGAGVSGAVVASATGLAAGQPIQIGVLSGALAGVYVRWLTAAYAGGTTLTWEPPLPQTCAVSDTVKGCPGYFPGTALAKSLDMALDPQAPAASVPSRELLGCVIEKLSIMLDGNLEPQIQFSGPAQGFAGTSPNFTPQAQPGGFTAVGAENLIPSGLTGYFQHGSTLYEIEKMQIDIVNGMELQNTAFGTTKASTYFRKGKRTVTFKISAKVSDSLTLWTPSLATSTNTIVVQIGTTSTRIFAVYLPFAVITDNPDTPDGDEPGNWDFEGQALGSVGNDELRIAAA